jgi:hypothetical protein
MIQKNTAVSETVLKVIIPRPGYEFHLLNECDAPETVRYFEKPGMTSIELCGVEFTNDIPCSTFVRDSE